MEIADNSIDFKVMREVILIITIFLAVPLKAQATEADSLYEAQVSVSSQAEEDRAIAVQEAFRKVLLKAVGNRQALARVPLAPILNEATQLVQQFRYSEPEEEDGLATLWVRFDPRGVEYVLRQHGLPVWGRMRPALLLWIAVEDGQRRYLLEAGMESPATEILKEQAKDRGIPVILPLWDLEDQGRLVFADIWGNFPDPILAASSRYPASVQLTGRLLHRQVGDWQARWTLYGAGEVRDWVVDGGIEQILRAGIDGAVDIIAAQVAPLNGDNPGASVQLNVVNVTSFMDYARLFSYLGSLSPVTEIQPIQLSPAEARFKLKLSGGPKGLVASIQLGRVLAPVPVEEGRMVEASASDTGGLNYQLLP